MIDFFFASWRFLRLMAILPAHIRLTVFFASRRFASAGDIIIDLASPGRYHHRFGLTTVPLRVVVSSISTHLRAPDDIIFFSALLVIYYLLFCLTAVPLWRYCFLFNPTATPFWQKKFLFGPTVAPLQAKFFL
jgi:hypothetical protein